MFFLKFPNQNQSSRVYSKREEQNVQEYLLYSLDIKTISNIHLIHQNYQVLQPLLLVVLLYKTS